MGAHLKLMPTPVKDVHDIPRMLRELADRIDSGDEDVEDCVVVVIDHQSMSTHFMFGAFRGDGCRPIGMLQMAISRMCGVARID